MLCVEIMKNAEEISMSEWNFFLRGAAGMDRQRPAKPKKDFINQHVWNNAYDISDTIDAFKGITNDLTATPVWIKLGTIEVRRKSIAREINLVELLSEIM